MMVRAPVAMSRSRWIRAWESVTRPPSHGKNPWLLLRYDSGGGGGRCCVVVMMVVVMVTQHNKP